MQYERKETKKNFNREKRTGNWMLYKKYLAEYNEEIKQGNLGKISGKE